MNKRRESTVDVKARLLTEDEAAAFLSVAPQTLALWRCRERYQLPYVKLGRLVRYRVQDLEEWIESRLIGGEAGIFAVDENGHKQKFIE